MSLSKQLTATNGAEVIYHRILNIELSDNSSELTIRVGSWPSEGTYTLGKPAIWNSYVKVPAGSLYLDTQVKLLSTLEFAGATILEEVDSLTMSKQAKWIQIKSSRGEREYGGFTWDGSIFDSDPTSQSRIQGAVILAMQDPQYQVNWTLKDNTTRVLSNADILAVGLALATHVETLHARAQALRTQIDAAQNVAEVNAISW